MKRMNRVIIFSIMSVTMKTFSCKSLRGSTHFFHEDARAGIGVECGVHAASKWSQHRLTYILPRRLTNATNAYKYLHLVLASTKPYRPICLQSVVRKADLGNLDINKDLIPSCPVRDAQVRTLLRQYLVLVLPGISRASVREIDDSGLHRAMARVFVA